MLFLFGMVRPTKTITVSLLQLILSIKLIQPESTSLIRVFSKHFLNLYVDDTKA